MRTTITFVLCLIATLCFAVEWEEIDIGPNLLDADCMEPDPAHSRVFIGGDEGYRFFDVFSGEYGIREIPGALSLTVHCLETDPTDPMFLLTGRSTCYWVGYIMDNYGLTIDGPWVWNGYQHGSVGAVFAMEMDPTDHTRLFACTYSDISHARILRSTNSGQTWEEVYPIWDYCFQDLAIDMTGTIYASYGNDFGPPGSESRILRSVDHGDTWQDATGDMNTDFVIKHIIVDPLTPGHLYAGQGGIWQPDDIALGLYESTDGGEHWVKILDGNIRQLSIHPDIPEILVAVIRVSGDIGGASIQLTRDGGETWEDITGSIPWFGGNEVCAISSADQRIYVGDDYDGFYRTDLFPTHVEPVVPALRALQIHPNPFNPNATISFTVDAPVHARIAVYDTAGREVIILAEKEFPSGMHRLQWRGQDSSGNAVSTGVYLIKASSQHSTETAKAVLLR